MAEMITKGTFEAPLAGPNVSLENYFRSSRNHQAQRLCADHRYAFPAQKPGEADLVNVFWEGKDSRHHQDRIGADDDRDFKILAGLFRFPVVASSALHALPMHPGFAGVENLQT